MARRGDNIYKRKDGRWEGRIEAPSAEIGQRKYIYFYGKTYTEVKAKIDAYRKNPPKPGKEYAFSMEEAAKIWIEDGKNRWKPTTYGTYRQIVEKYIVPALGNKKIRKINGRVLEEFYSHLGNEKKAILSGSYRAYITACVRRILLYIGKKYGCELYVPPLPVPSKPNKIELPRERAMAALESYLQENRREETCLGIAIALYTGIRIGELCALIWEDIDMEEKVIRIRRNMQRVRVSDGKNKTEVVVLTPKTTDSAREIPISPALGPFLQECGKGKSGFVVSGIKNDWIDIRTLQYRFRRILEKCGVEYFRFHMLRHAFATRCVSMGFDIKSLSEILGHSNVKITMSLYVHPTIQQKKQLMDRFAPYTAMDCPAED